MRHHHKHTVLAAAAVAALSLGLTACGGGEGTGTKDEGAASSRTAATVKPDATSKTDADASGSDGSDGSGGSGTAKGGTTARTAARKKGGTPAGGSAADGSTGSGKSSGSSIRACAYGDVRITVQRADETPTEHVVLTARNISGHSCRLLQYPLLAFGPVQTAKDIPAVAKSRPEVPVVLAPGAPAYANVRIARGGVHEDNKVVTSFTVNLFAPDGPAEGSVDVHAPAGGLAVDEAVARTGYWTEELRDGADEF